MAKYYYQKYSASWYINNKIYTNASKQLVSKSELEMMISQFAISLFLINPDKTFTKTALTNVRENEIYLLIEEYKMPPMSNQSLNIFYMLDNKYYVITETVTIGDVEFKKENLVETIKAEDGTYPGNGVHTDGYWYVKGDKATIPVLAVENGKEEEIAEAYYVENDIAIPIKAYEVENDIATELW